MQSSFDYDAVGDQMQVQASRIIEYLILGVALALVPIAMLVVYFAVAGGWSAAAVFQLIAFSVVWLLAFNKHFLSPRVRAATIASFLLITALSEVFRYGLVSATFPMLAVVPILGTVIGGRKLGFAGIGVSATAMAVSAWLAVSGQIVPPVILPDFFFSAEQWGVRIVNFVVAAGIGVAMVGSLYQFHQRSAAELRLRNADLQKSHTRVVQSAKLAGLGYSVTDQTTGRVLECDDAYANMHGLTVDEFTSLDISGGIIGKLIHEDDREEALNIRPRLLNGESLISEFRHVLPSGDTRYIRKIFSPMHPDGAPDGMVEIVSQDVTEAGKLNEQLFQTQKMDAIGKLTGGVAHDFNNLLAVILGNLELLEDDITDPEQKDLIKRSIDATMHGSELTRNMLSFARRAPLQPTILDLNQLARNIESWIRRTIPSSIDVEMSLPPDLWPVEIDASSAESGLLNLILNARDAMVGGGTLTIETSNQTIDEVFVDARGEHIEPGRYVLLAVSDTGEGILEENMAMIFEPFFTTKPVGMGSGLGLSMLQGFVRQSSGMVRVYSEPGVGTTFKLYFPAAEKAERLKQSIDLYEYLPVERGGTTVLLVEDNADVLKLLRSMLTKAGYRVLTANSGDEALNVFEAGAGVDLVLTDIVMPGELQGTTLAKVLRAKRPDLPFVFMSGYASEATVHGNGLQPNDIRLMKPIQRGDLLRAMHKATKRRENPST